jgi:hypothetical protein
MQIGSAQIGVDQEDSAILLACESVCKIVGYKSLTLAWERAGNQNAAQGLLVANLIQTRP